MGDRLPRSMVRDLAALDRAADEFERLHGEDARRRWARLGAEPAGELAERQLAVVERRGPPPEVWDTLAWEVRLRIELLETAREALDRKGTPA